MIWAQIFEVQSENICFRNCVHDPRPLPYKLVTTEHLQEPLVAILTPFLTNFLLKISDFIQVTRQSIELLTAYHGIPHNPTDPPNETGRPTRVGPIVVYTPDARARVGTNLARGTHPDAKPGRASRRPQEVRVCRNPASPGCMPVDARSGQPMNAATNAIATTAPNTPISVRSRDPAAPFAIAPIRKRRAAAMSQTVPDKAPTAPRSLAQTMFLKPRTRLFIDYP